MKTTLLALSLTLALSACVATDDKTSSISENTRSASIDKLDHKPELPSSPLVLNNGKPSASEIEITLEKIMSDPDWIGRAPTSWYWGDNSDTIYYQQKRVGNPLTDLYQKSLTVPEKNGAKVALDVLHLAADRFARTNLDKTQKVYAFEGNVFVKYIATGEVKQLTSTSAIERDAMFLTNGNVAYRAGNKFFEHDLTTHKINELASLLLKSAPEAKSSKGSYLAKEQSKLIDYIALTQRNSSLKAAQKDKLKANNQTVTKTEFYLGADKRLVHASLSPKGDKMLISVTKKVSSRKASDIMPNYISESGNIIAEKVRHRVADNRQYSEELLLLDLNSGMKFPLSYDSLTGFDEDVLAKVRAENFQKRGQEYQTSKKPRNIHVMGMSAPIQWQKNGEQVAVMLEAWDNKDRWLATVNLLENKLVTQDRLHDEAWINYYFNQFGWLHNSQQLYYLSEESGYSHLYVKSLNRKNSQVKAQAVTQGAFEISNVTLSADESQFYFKANKSHPGIYEIYRVDVNGENFSALTQLGGMNDYALSPDESKLLIQHSTVTMPPELYVQEVDKPNSAQQITDTVSDEFKAMPWVAPSVVAVPSSHQESPIYSRVYLPHNFNVVAKKLPAVMFSHGAGYLQNSHLGWSSYFREFMFHSLLVQQGYAVIDMDYRASKGYGRDWRTAIYRNMGTPELEDMLDGVNWLVENANVDEARVGTYGGSYGGFLTLMALFKQPDAFQSGAAIRLVSDWAYYNHGYTANILNTPEDDAIAYERSSPIYFAQGLNKPLLINAPMVDDNVFFQDTVRLVQRLIELEKQDFETAIYPVEPHGFVQPSSWLDEYRRIYKLFKETL